MGTDPWQPLFGRDVPVISPYGDGTSVADFLEVSRDDWALRAMAAAGIDPDQWDPSKGFAGNKENIEKVYALYAQWYLDHPELKWAGMAKLAGGTVYAGFMELSGPAEMGLPIATDVDAMFVEMQKNIFMDMAWQHQAYVEGGMDAITAAYMRGDMDYDLYEAWSLIDAGKYTEGLPPFDPAVQEQMWEGNARLLHREQTHILPPDYARLNELTGGLFIPSAISDKTTSPIPEGKSFRELYPDGDITNTHDRWTWIENQMLPEYRALGDMYTSMLVQQPLDELARQEFVEDPMKGLR